MSPPAELRGLLVVAAAVLCCSGALRADDPQVRIVSAEVGFAGRMKVGCWTPVRVTIDGPAGQTVEPRLIAPDPDGSATTWPLPGVTLDGSGPRQSLGLFRLGRIRGTVRIEAGTSSLTLEPARTDAAGLRCDRQSAVFIGLLGPAAGFEQEFGAAPTETEADADAPPDGSEQPVRLVKFDSPRDLPDSAEALDSLDVLVVSRIAPPDTDRSAAVSQWVAGGGHLVLMLAHGGPDAELPFLWAPIETRGTRRFNDLAGLTDRVRGGDAILARSGVEGTRIRIASGRTLVSSLEGPLVVRVAHGLGRITVFALDWTQPPLIDWKGLPGLCRYLADLTRDRGDDDVLPASTQLRPTGVSDLTTQLAAQLDTFPEVERPSYWTVIGFVMLFLLVAGPLDYLIVHYWLKRPQVTWMTFPLWVVLASLGGTLYASSHNAARLQCNQLDLVDIDASTGLIRVRSWMTLYSPEPRRYRVEPAMADWLAEGGGDASGGLRLTWSGSPESGFRGMYRAEGLDLGNPPYALQAEASGIVNLPIDQWSTKALGTWWQQVSAESVAALVESNLQKEGDHRLAGTVTHHLPASITGWCLAYHTLAYVPRRGESVLEVPALDPGVPWAPDQRVQPHVLKGYLTGVRFRPSRSRDKMRQQDVQARSEYDPLGDDPELLARTLTFHAAAGAAEFTSLQNDPLARWDLTRLLELDRAVLFGRIELPATTYRIDGEEISPRQRTTFVRIVLPVSPAPGAN